MNEFGRDAGKIKKKKMYLLIQNVNTVDLV